MTHVQQDVRLRACFAQASQLYCERMPRSSPTGGGAAFRTAVGMDDADVREGMALMDAWCVAAAAESGLRRTRGRFGASGCGCSWAGTPDAPN
ncbi:MAG: hypothetical protein ACLT98_15940 [Eggerthellaceae bacterium]